MDGESEILFEVSGGLGRITLNRPRVLNALTHGMCLALDAKLKAWAEDDEVHAALIRSASERAFSAGGDLMSLYDARDRLEDFSNPFYRDEYSTIARLFHFPKPYVALLDGVVMGAGVGVSIHGSHRVVSENAFLAMPETGIGLFPDVGATHFLPRCPGAIGTYLGLTGTRVRAADSLYAGLADFFVPRRRFGEIETALATADLSGDAHAAVSAVLQAFAEDAGSAPLAQHRDAIERCFAPPSPEEIIAALGVEEGEWAAKTAAGLKTKSPTSLKIACRQLPQGASLSFDDCMRLEYRLVRGCLAGHDFYEGIRAAVVDKDRNPSWRPDHLDAVSEALIEPYFESLGEDELFFDWERQSI